MPPRQKLHRKGHSKRVKRFAEDNEFGLDPESTLNVDDLLTERKHLMTATFIACFTLLFWIISIGECSVPEGNRLDFGSKQCRWKVPPVDWQAFETLHCQNSIKVPCSILFCNTVKTAAEARPLLEVVRAEKCHNCSVYRLHAPMSLNVCCPQGTNDLRKLLDLNSGPAATHLYSVLEFVYSF